MNILKKIFSIVKTEKNGSKLSILRGTPGSGKSTFAKRLLAEGIVDFHFEADMWMVDKEGNYVFDPTRLKFCHNSCFNSCVEKLIAEKNVVVSNTFLQKWEAERYVKAAREIGSDIEILVMTGDYGSVHGVPDWKMKEMRERFEDFSLEDFD